MNSMNDFDIYGDASDPQMETQLLACDSAGLITDISKSKRRSAHIQGFLGKSTRGGDEPSKNAFGQSSEQSNRRSVSSTLRRKRRTNFQRMRDEAGSGSSNPLTSSEQRRSTCSTLTNDESTTGSLADDSSAMGEPNLPRNDDDLSNLGPMERPLRMRKASLEGGESEEDRGSECSGFPSQTSFDGTSVSSALDETPESLIQGSGTLLELMDNLDDIDETYMLSVFWSAGDSAPMGNDGGSSVAGETRCSYASSCSTSTSVTNYTWTSSVRRRHHGAYQHRSKVISEAPKASWFETMEESSSLLFGAFKGWTARGGLVKESVEWDPNSTWECLDPVVDDGEREMDLTSF